MASQRQAMGRDRRKDDRFDVQLDATIKAYRMAPLSAALVDISAGGAMFKSEEAELAKGDEVLVAAGPIEAVATIAWAHEAFYGLAFHRRLDDHQLARLRRVGHA